MGYASISGRARTSAKNPRAFGVCDNCGIWYNHDTLRWQFDWAGSSLINKRILVCRSCYDTPQQQLRSFSPPADPVPIINPRPERYAQAETNYRTTSGAERTYGNTGIPIASGSMRITEDDEYRVTQQTGEPPGGLNVAPGTHLMTPPEAGGLDPGLPIGANEIPLTGPLTTGNMDDWSNDSGLIVSWSSETGDIAYWFGV